jgi:hypothetical protein
LIVNSDADTSADDGASAKKVRGVLDKATSAGGGGPTTPGQKYYQINDVEEEQGRAGGAEESV